MGRIKVFFLSIHLALLLASTACQPVNVQESNEEVVVADSTENIAHETFLMVLGNVQDAGSPHISCKKDCCSELFAQPDPSRKVVALGVVDIPSQSKYLFEASPDMAEQLRYLHQQTPQIPTEMPNGIFLTHAHIGHYTGLMYLGKEAMNASKIPVYAMPRMKSFLEENGPWSQLVRLQNIVLQELIDQQALTLSDRLEVIPFRVPHRDEYSETVGYIIKGPNKSALFIPDIDKWEKWERDIETVISAVDYAFLDATFFDGEEINNRDVSEIPHPFIIESMARFAHLPVAERNKIHFIHLNHTNPALDPTSEQSHLILEKGFGVARLGDVFEL